MIENEQEDPMIDRHLVIKNTLLEGDALNAFIKQEKERKNFFRVGFSNVVKLFVKHKPLLVGHNLFLDLLYTFHFLFPLPPTYEEFRESCLKKFPFLTDTKYLIEYCRTNKVPKFGPPKRLDASVPKLCSRVLFSAIYF